jgi:hypothetical protein
MTWHPSWQPDGSSFGHAAAPTFAQYVAQGAWRVGSFALCRKHAAEVSDCTPQSSSEAFPVESHETVDVPSQAKSAVVAVVQAGLLRSRRHPRAQSLAVP